jgi:drug/metabolite transporter (DMT)-like permease
VMKMLAISLAVGTAANLMIDGLDTFKAAQAMPLISWLLLVWLGVICTAVGYTAWFIVIRDCPLNVMAMTIFAQTIFGVAIAALWVGEKLHWGHLLGGIVITSGLAVGLSHQVRKRI